MQYTVKQLADMAGITPRTLRWYDRMGLVCPEKKTAAGYRLYGSAAVDRLQQVLLYRAMDMSLQQIAEVLDAPDFDRRAALEAHLQALQARREALDSLIDQVRRSLDAERRGFGMKDEEKLAAFKQHRMAENEAKYGAEVREKYGNEAVDMANRQMLSLSEEEETVRTRLEEEILQSLTSAVRAGESPEGEAGREVAEKHLQWLRLSMGACDRAMQRMLTAMYAEDARFLAYYDREVPGCAAFLKAAVEALPLVNSD